MEVKEGKAGEDLLPDTDDFCPPRPPPQALESWRSVMKLVDIHVSHVPSAGQFSIALYLIDAH